MNVNIFKGLRDQKLGLSLYMYLFWSYNKGSEIIRYFPDEINWVNDIKD